MTHNLATGHTTDSRMEIVNMPEKIRFFFGKFSKKKNNIFLKYPKFSKPSHKITKCHHAHISIKLFFGNFWGFLFYWEILEIFC